MLVITRKNGQKIMINDNIEITIVEAKNGVCKVAIKADKDVKIYRETRYLNIVWYLYGMSPDQMSTCVALASEVVFQSRGQVFIFAQFL